MPELDLDEVIESCKAEARDIARFQEHGPILTLLKGGEPKVVLLAGRQSVSQQLHTVLAREQPDAYVLVTEARLRAGGREPAYVGEIADNPELPELLFVIGSPRGGPVRHWKANIWPAANRAARRRGEREVGMWENVVETIAGTGLAATGAMLVENW